MSGYPWRRAQVTTIGAKAINGTVWETFIQGKNPLSANLHLNMKIASINPTITPSEKPIAASKKVNAAFLAR